MKVMSVRKKPKWILRLTAPIKQEDTLEHERLGNNSYLLCFNSNSEPKYSSPPLKHEFFLHNSSRPWIFNCILFFSSRRWLTRKWWKIISLEEKVHTSWKINLGKLSYERSIPVWTEALKSFSCSKTKTQLPRWYIYSTIGFWVSQEPAVNLGFQVILGLNLTYCHSPFKVPGTSVQRRSFQRL